MENRSRHTATAAWDPPAGAGGASAQTRTDRVPHSLGSLQKGHVCELQNRLSSFPFSTQISQIKHKTLDKSCLFSFPPSSLSLASFQVFFQQGRGLLNVSLLSYSSQHQRRLCRAVTCVTDQGVPVPPPDGTTGSLITSATASSQPAAPAGKSVLIPSRTIIILAPGPRRIRSLCLNNVSTGSTTFEIHHVPGRFLADPLDGLVP